MWQKFNIIFISMFLLVKKSPENNYQCFYYLTISLQRKQVDLHRVHHVLATCCCSGPDGQTKHWLHRGPAVIFAGFASAVGSGQGHGQCKGLCQGQGYIYIYNTFCFVFCFVCFTSNRKHSMWDWKTNYSTHVKCNEGITHLVHWCGSLMCFSQLWDNI